MLNIAVLEGRLVQDPELKKSPSDVSVCNFIVAVKRKYSKDTTDFIDVVAWRQNAEYLSKYFSKGDMVSVVGSIQVRSWEDKNGNKRRSVEVKADEVSAYSTSKGSSERNNKNDAPVPDLDENDEEEPF